MVSELLSLMPPHTRYCEAYFGGGSFLLNKPCEGIAEWANDIDGELTNFWTVLQNPLLFDAFRRHIEAVPFSQVEFESAKEPLEPGSDYTSYGGYSVTRASNFFIRNRQSRQGLGRDFATPTTRLRRGMNENVSAWLSAVEGLPEIHARLKRVEIRCQEATDFIRELDTPDTLFYCDPPYLHETRSSTGEYGEHEMTRPQHQLLLDTLTAIKGKFMLSGYQNGMYEAWAQTNGWRRVDFEHPNQASSKRTKERKIECVWMNY